MVVVRWEQLLEELIQARKRRKISVIALAKTLGVVRATVYNWENGRNAPSIDLLHQWCAEVGLGLSFEIDGMGADPDAALMRQFVSSADPEVVASIRRLLQSYAECKSDLVISAAE